MGRTFPLDFPGQIRYNPPIDCEDVGNRIVSSVVCRSPPFREPRLGCERAGALPMNFSIGVMNLIAKSRYCVMYLKLGGTAGDLVP